MKYEHTPLHTTVAQLVERLLAILSPPPVQNGNTPNANRSAKVKRPPPTEREESSRKKKRTKRAKNGDEDAPAEDELLAQGPVATADAQATPVLNIPPLEVIRRTELATTLLKGRGIEPVTLSAEQFGIFANQAPHLQEASLDMLAMYGAERLRIIHPDDKAPPASPASTPVQQTTPVNEVIGGSTPATDTPSKRKKLPKKKSDPVIVDDAEFAAVRDTSNLPAEAMPGTQPRKRKTRGTCNTCKSAKRKCTKEHPQCSTCLVVGDECAYLPPKPRGRKSETTAEMAEDDDSDIVNVAENHNSHAPPTPEHLAPAPAPVIQTTQVAAVVYNPDDDDFIPDPINLSESTQHPPPVQSQGSPPPCYQQPDIASSAHDQESALPIAPHQHSGVMSALNFSQSRTQEIVSQASPGLALSSIQTPGAAKDSPEVSFLTPASTTASARRITSRKDRRGLQTTQNDQTSRPTPDSTAHTQAASSPNTDTQLPVLGAQTRIQSPTVIQKQPAKPPTPRRLDAGSDTPAFDGLQAAAVLSQTPIPVPYQEEGSAVTKSPSQIAARPPSRVKSRQAQRSQNHTPVTQTPVPPPVIPVPHSMTATASKITAAPVYDSFSRYNNTTTDQYSQSYDQTSASASPNTYSTPSYDHSRNSTSDNTLNQALNDTSNYHNLRSGNTGLWNGRNRSSQSKTPVNVDSTPHIPGNNTQPATSHSFSTQSAQRQTAAQTTAYIQPQAQQPQQQHSYNSYPPQPSASGQHNQNWFGFPSASNNTNHANYDTTTRDTGFGLASTTAAHGFNQGQRSDASEYTGYGQQELYDLLRANNNH